MTARRQVQRRLVRWGDRNIVYYLTFAPRTRLSITVHPDLRVEVVAPEGKSVEEVEARVLVRRSWIARHLRDVERFHPQSSPRRWISGESHWYLGRQYRLSVQTGPAKVWRAGGRIFVQVPGKLAPAKVRRAMQEWYVDRAREVFRERLDHLRSGHARLGRLRPLIRVLWMTRCWGSCSTAGTVSLNAELVRAPLSSIDYVIVHELCHLLEPRHSERFYRLLGKFAPEWRRHRDRLDRPFS